MSGLPISAEARGRLRLWRARQKKISDRIMTYLDDREFNLAAADVSRKKGRIGRARALMRMRVLMKRAGLRQFGETRWAFICCDVPPFREAVHIRQVTVGLKNYASTSCPWGISFTDHALARVLQRMPGSDLTQVIWDAHAEVLQIGWPDDVNRFRVKAGLGSFAGGLVKIEDKMENVHLMILAKTWLPDETLHEVQEKEVAAVGEEGRQFCDVFDYLERRAAEKEGLI
jgi:hypothetical protein